MDSSIEYLGIDKKDQPDEDWATKRPTERGCGKEE